jgi:hypothetical protein
MWKGAELDCNDSSPKKLFKLLQQEYSETLHYYHIIRWHFDMVLTLHNLVLNCINKAECLATEKVTKAQEVCKKEKSSIQD